MTTKKKEPERKLHPADTWTQAHESDFYQIYLVAEEDVYLRDEAFPLNYAIVYAETNRVEGYVPTLCAALDTVHMLENNLRQHQMIEEARSIKFVREEEQEEDPEAS